MDGNITKDPVIPLPLDKLYKNDANIPIIIGHTTDEALLFFMGNFNEYIIFNLLNYIVFPRFSKSRFYFLTGNFDNKHTFKLYNDNLDDIIKNKLKLKDPSKLLEIMKFVREFYLKNQPINEDTVWNLVRLLSDLTFKNLNRKVIDARNKYANAPTYVYNFSYLGDEPTFYQFDQGPQPYKGSIKFYLNFICIYNKKLSEEIE